MTRPRRLAGVPTLGRIWTFGELPPDDQPWLAVVGTRRCSRVAEQVVSRLVTPLARAGVVIVSGLAYGIDAFAHRAALAGNGRTVAVLASGVDQPTPAGNRALARDIVEHRGALVSSYPAGTPARKGHFPARNRIVAALCDATLVVEAPRRSGALITAADAQALGRLVLAVPGSILSASCEGSNDLLRSTATCVTSASDVASHLGVTLGAVNARTSVSGTDQRLLIALANGPLPLDDLARETGLSSAELLPALTRLELAGLARLHDGVVFVHNVTV